MDGNFAFEHCDDSIAAALAAALRLYSTVRSCTVLTTGLAVSQPGLSVSQISTIPLTTVL